MGTIPASENVFPLVELAEGAAPATPATGQVRLYVKSDGLLYWKDDAGTEYAAGDAAAIAAHTGDTSDAHDASAVSVTPTGGVSSTDVQAAIAELDAAITGGAVPSGSSFPGSPSSGDWFFRTDLGMSFSYNGTRWHSEIRHMSLVNTDALLALSATGALRSVVPVWGVTGADIWVEDYQAWFFVGSGASALSGSHKWVITLQRTGGTVIGTINIDSGASNAHRQSSIVAVDALLGATAFELQALCTKTGTPGALFVQCAISYRYVAT